MKTIKFLTAVTLMSAISACSNSETEKSAEQNSANTETEQQNESANQKSTLPNEIITLKFGGQDQSFDQKDVYANYSKTFLSYRVMYLNYDKSEDSDYGERTGDQIKIIVFLHNPAGGKFKPGKYTPSGDESGFNKGYAQIENADGTMMINTAVEDPGYVEVVEVDDQHIVGEYHLNGKLLTDNSVFEIEGTFNTENEK